MEHRDLMQLADAYANASFEQGLNQSTEDPKPELAREKLSAAIKAELQRSEKPLTESPNTPVEIYCYWPDGSRKYMNFDRWPQRKDLPGTAVRFDIAVPDPSISRNKKEA